MRRLRQDSERARCFGAGPRRRMGVSDVALLGLLGLLLGGCDGGTVVVEVAAVHTVNMDPHPAIIHEQETLSLRAVPRDARGRELTGRAVTWSSSNSARATVSNDGIVTGVSAGPVTIRARVEGVEGQASLTVAPVPVASVVVSPSNASIEVGSARQLTLTATDASGNVLAGRPATWRSSNVSVATVSSTGRVTAREVGLASITATVEGRNAGAQVTVVPAAARLASIGVGGAHTCGITTGGVAYCWGSGGHGRLGNGGRTDFFAPDHFTPHPVSGILRFASIAVGDVHTCGITPGGVAYCWGESSHGKLGNGGTESQSTPQPVAGSHSFASIAVGDVHTCAITTGGVGYCWGAGYVLGNGGTASRVTPHPVAGSHRFAAIAAGGTHTCGVTTGGVAYCWGQGHVGQLGNGRSGMIGGGGTSEGPPGGG